MLRAGVMPEGRDGRVGEEDGGMRSFVVSATQGDRLS